MELTCDAGKVTNTEDGVSKVAELSPIPTAPTTNSGCFCLKPAKKHAATSPISFPPSDEAVVKAGPSLLQPCNQLLTFNQFTRMPLDVWLLFLSFFSPIDLLNLAYAHRYFKEQITNSPKRWGGVWDISNNHHYRTRGIDATFYMITSCPGSWDSASKYLLVYGDEYGYTGALKDDYFLTLTDEGRCMYIRPGDDRIGPAKQDLFILLNNATLDEYGFGFEWNLPALHEYVKAPTLRAHMIILDIKTRKEHICQQIASFNPSAVAVHANPLAGPLELRAVVHQLITGFPGLKLLWLHVGHQLAELSVLAEVKTPSIVACCWMSQKKVERPHTMTYERSAVLAKQLEQILEPALATLILQWERDEREIDYIVLYSHCVSGADLVKWDKLTPKVALLAGNLADGKSDAIQMHGDPRTYLIRRRHGSNEGLLIAVRKNLVFLTTCDYNFRRHVTLTECIKYANAVMHAQGQVGPSPPMRYDQNGKRLVPPPYTVIERLSHKRRFDARAEQFWNDPAYSATPKRELALHHFLASSEPHGTRYLSFPQLGLDITFDDLEPVLEYYSQHLYKANYY